MLHDFDERTPGETSLALDTGGQWVLPGIVRSELINFEYLGAFASRWFPAGRDALIVVDPHVAAGRPTLQGTGVTLDTLRKRFAAGQSIHFIAQDYELEGAQVEKALQFATAAA